MYYCTKHDDFVANIDFNIVFDFISIVIPRFILNFAKIQIKENRMNPEAVLCGRTLAIITLDTNFNRFDRLTSRFLEGEH